MKETIYSIPINEAFEAESGCPLCALRAQLEKDALEYVLGAAMMEPDIRMETNRLGFCPSHLSEMTRANKRLPLGLLLQTRIAELRKQVRHINPETARSCYICSRVEGFFEKYISNTLYLWNTQPEFVEKMKKAGLCLPHACDLYNNARSAMSKKSAAELHSVLLGKISADIDKYEALVSTFVKSFDHRFADMELGEAKSAIESASKWLGV